MNLIRLPIWILLAALVGGCNGCHTKTPDPLAGWRESDFREFHANKAIMDDYQSYVKTLSQEEQKNIVPVFCYENGTGQHAVKIVVALDGEEWSHILIYDKDNKRIKTIRYLSGHYAS